MIEELMQEWTDATRRAYDAMARYKFWMFGYHAARVVFVASLVARAGGPRLPNPFAGLVDSARAAYCRDCGEMRGTSHRCTAESLLFAEPLQQLALPEHREEQSR